MRAYNIALYIMCFNIGFAIFTLVVALAGATSCETVSNNPGCALLYSLPEDMRILDQPGTIADGRTWQEQIEYYEQYNYTERVETTAEAQTTTWGSALKGLQVFIGTMKMGVFGVYIIINSLLGLTGMDTVTRVSIAVLFQTGVYAIYTIGLSQYIRGSGMKGYE